MSMGLDITQSLNAQDIYDEIFEEMRAGGADHIEASDVARRRTIAATGVEINTLDQSNALGLDFS